MERISEVDYVKVAHFLNACASKKATPTPNLTKTKLKELLCLDQSDRERELVWCTAFKASGMSFSGARKHFGFQCMPERLARVQQCVLEVQCIQECIDELSMVRQQATLKSMGLVSESGDDDSISGGEETDTGTDEDSTVSEPQCPIPATFPTDQQVGEILQKSHFNWFQLVDVVCKGQDVSTELHLCLEEYYSKVMSSDRSQSEKVLIDESHQAYMLMLVQENKWLIDKQKHLMVWSYQILSMKIQMRI